MKIIFGFKQLFKLLSITILITTIGCQRVAPIPTASTPITQPSAAVQPTRTNSAVKFKILSVSASPLEQGFQPQPKVLVFRNQQSWSKFWQNSPLLNENLQKPAAPKVNFPAEMVIALTSGSKPTGGYRLRIDSIQSLPSTKGNRWQINYTETVPGKDCILTQQTTTPTVFIITKNTNAALELQEKKITANCSS